LPCFLLLLLAELLLTLLAVGLLLLVAMLESV
jgi:hypothetical protein